MNIIKGIKVYAIRVQENPGRRVWDVFNEDASVRVRHNGSLHDGVELVAERVGLTVAKVIQYQGVMLPAEAALIVADHEQTADAMEGRR